MASDLDAVIATLPPPWNADVVDVALEVNNNCERVDYWYPRPGPPSRWVDEVDDEDSDGNWYVIREARRKTLAEFSAEVSAYRVALTVWDRRRAEGKPLMLTGFVPGVQTTTVRVTLANGSRATIIGDGERWKVTEEWHGK